jgi:hypothetical protein
MPDSDDASPVRFATLEEEWRVLRSELSGAEEAEPFRIRMHRSFSWIRRFEVENADADTGLIVLWIAFNALFGRWDKNEGQPRPDYEARERFTKDILGLDIDGLIPRMLQEQRDLVMQILDDEYVARHFWADPSDRTAMQAKQAKFNARTWYLENNHRQILDYTLSRVYIVRCQLMHGAATHGSRLNRESLARSVAFLEGLLAAVLEVLIKNGRSHDWSELCYPPQW